MSLPPNPYVGGMPGRTPSPNPYRGGNQGQRSPWGGHSSPRQYSPYSNSSFHNQSQGSTPGNQWTYSPHHSGGSPRFTPPHRLSCSPIPMQQPFSTPYSNNRGQRGRPSMGGNTTPYGGDKKQGQKTFYKDKRFSSGGGGGRGGYRRGSDTPIERYVNDDMLANPWADLESKEQSSKAAT